MTRPPKVRAVRALAESISPERARAVFGSTRWLVVAGDAVCADALAVSLRDLGAVVRLIDPAGLALGRLGAFDAQFLLTERGQDLRFLRERVSGHPILRWASPLSLSWSELWRPGIPTPHLGRLAQAALPALEPERALIKSLKVGGTRSEVNLEKLGPARALRALCAERDVFRLRIESLHERGEIELAGELIVGASFELAGFPPLTGVPALSRTLELSAVRATIERRVRLSLPTLSMDFEQGLELALRDLRERDGSDSPTLRMASPLALLETEQTEVTEDEIPTLMRPLDPPLLAAAEPSFKPFTVVRDSAVVDKIHEAETKPPPMPGMLPPLPMAAPTAMVATDAERPLPSRARAPEGEHRPLRAAPLLGTPRDSLMPTASTEVPRAQASRMQWLGLSATAIIVTLLAMVAAERIWDDEPEVSAAPQAEQLEPSAGRVSSAPPKPVAPTPRVVPGPSAPVKATPQAAHPAAPEKEALDATELERMVKKALSAEDAVLAVHYAERLVAVKPERARVRVLYGDALLAAGHRADALAQYRIAEERAPRSRLVRSRIARMNRD